MTILIMGSGWSFEGFFLTLFSKSSENGYISGFLDREAVVDGPWNGARAIGCDPPLGKRSPGKVIGRPPRECILSFIQKLKGMLGYPYGAYVLGIEAGVRG